MDGKRTTFGTIATRLGLAIALALVIVCHAGASYRVTRPVADAAGHPNETYLYGEYGAGTYHKGVDFSVITGTPVYAIARGVVVDKYEAYVPHDGDDNLDEHGYGFGNYVLVRHTQRHYDRTTSSWAWVYSLCGHLDHNGVLKSIGQSVAAGELIALCDHTGNSSAPHLHLQIMLHPQSDRTKDTLGTESRSRNPELWLSPYGGSTGTVVGRLANSNGDLLNGWQVKGLQKQSGWGYGYSQTYAYSFLNRDDLLLENWGTTDVSPGSYALRAESGGNTIQLGTHNVAAGQVTYVNLYPMWLPHLSEWDAQWQGTLHLWNQNSSDRTWVYTTLSQWDEGLVALQDGRAVPARAGMQLSSPAGWQGDGLVVPGREASAAVLNRKLYEPHSGSAYSGIPASKLSDRAYVPMLLNWKTTADGTGYSRIFVQNAGPAPAAVTLRFYDPSGSLRHTGNVTLEPNGVHRDDLYDLPLDWYGSAEISANTGARLAVVWEIRIGYHRLMTAEGFPAHAPHSEWLVPLFTVRLANGLSTPVTFQNTSGSTISTGGLQMVCTKDPGSPNPPTLTMANTSSIANRANYAFNPVSDGSLPAGWYGSCRLTSSRGGVAFVQMRYVFGTGNPENAAAHEAIPTTVTTRALSFPRVAQNPPGGGFATAATIQNISNAYTAHVTLRYYGAPECGSGNVGPLNFSIPPGGSLIRNHRLAGTDGLPPGWCGYLQVTSSDQPIDGFIQLTNWNNPPGDTFMTHNATLHP